MEPASLFREKTLSERRTLTVFRAEMLGQDELSWRDLFSGFDRLKAITYSSGLDVILELTGIFKEVEVTFGSERSAYTGGNFGLKGARNLQAANRSFVTRL